MSFSKQKPAFNLGSVFRSLKFEKNKHPFLQTSTRAHDFMYSVRLLSACHVADTVLGDRILAQFPVADGR